MKRTCIFGFLATSLLFASCDKTAEPEQTSGESNLIINVDNILTKGLISPTDENDKKINNWGVFVFDNNDAGKILVAGDRNISGATTTRHLKVKQFSSLTVYAVANIVLTEAECCDLNTFESYIRNLKDEKMDGFAMVGCSQTSANAATTTVNVALRRLVARVHVQNISVNFDDNPRLNGKTISDIKVYLKNAPTTCTLKMNSSGAIYMQNGTNDANGVSFAHTDFNIQDCIGITDTRKISIADNSSAADNYFHCYQKDFDSNPNHNQDKPVRLVIKGILDGKVQYWGFDINTDGTGYDATKGKYGITANHVYNLNVTINNWGSDNEDTDPAYTGMTVNTTVVPWTEHTLFGIAY